MIKRYDVTSSPTCNMGNIVYNPNNGYWCTYEDVKKLEHKLKRYEEFAEYMHDLLPYEKEYCRTSVKSKDHEFLKQLEKDILEFGMLQHGEIQQPDGGEND